MKFNMQIFNRLATRAFYKVSGGETNYAGYSLDETLSIFECYFDTYEWKQGHPHPNIRIAQIERIIEVMPFYDYTGVHNNICDIPVECYLDVINKHFQTEYQNCDYNINHFFSGEIRALRYFEELY